MPRIRTMDELNALREAARERRDALRREKIVVNVSLATCGIAAGGLKALEALKDEVAKRQLGGVVEIMQSGCMTYCHSEPTVEISRPGEPPVVFGGVDEAKARTLISEYVVKGEPVDGVIPVNYVRAAF